MDTQTLTRPDGDVRRQLRPSREQLRVAAAMFSAATEDVTAVVVPVVVPVVLPDRQDGVPAAVRSVEHPGGFWLADRGSRDGAYGFRVAREAAEAAARGYLAARGAQGLAGWISIRSNGTWAALDGSVPAPR